jgi:hypothetical protein
MSYWPVVPGARIERTYSDFQSDVSTTITIQAVTAQVFLRAFRGHGSSRRRPKV